MNADKIFTIVEPYSYNAYEVCRILNGHQPDQFKECFANRTELHDRCNKKLRGCATGSRSVERCLKRMQKNRKVQSIKLRWFDKGRKINGLCTDNFRF